MSGPEALSILLVDDDEEITAQLQEADALKDIGGKKVRWTFYNKFDEAIEHIRHQRFDIVISDIYQDREGVRKTIASGDIKAKEIVELIRKTRFTPIVIISDGQLPEDLVAEPLIAYADKAKPSFPDLLKRKVEDLLATGVPEIASKLHDDIDRFTADFIWGYLLKSGDNEPSNLPVTDELEQIIRKRAALHLGIGGSTPPRAHATAADYYILPPIFEALRLGSLLRTVEDKSVHLVLNPHCHLASQSPGGKPRADKVLLAKCSHAIDTTHTLRWKAGSDNSENLDRLRRVVGVPSARTGSPDGRNFFLPAILDIPDLLCDLMDLETIEFEDWHKKFEKVADLDSPYCEALQACFTQFYSGVGVNNLQPTQFGHLMKIPTS